MNALSNFITVLVVNLLPFDPTIRMSVGLVLGQLLDKCLEYLSKHGHIYNIWFIRRFFSYNTVKFSSENYQFYDLIDYYYKKYNSIIKDANVIHIRGSRHLMIESLSRQSIVDTYEDNNIYIQINKIGESKVDDMTVSNHNIIFSSNQPTEKINKYIENLLKIISKSVDREFTIYNINVETTDKHRKVSWNHGRSISNKTIENVIVSEKVQRDFYNDMEIFWTKEDNYNKRGITFKRGYLLHGPPGSGKSSIIASIVNEHQLPIFKFDMSIIEENSELTRLNDTIYDYIGMSERHVALFEDIDRCTLFDRYTRGSAITMDALLNVLDGVNGAHGRITIMTANDISSLKRVQGLLRPGRIDRIIELSMCSNMQIKQILALNFDDKEVKDITINNNIELTPASLNKLIQIAEDYDLVIDYLNKHPIVNDDDLENIRDIKESIADKPIGDKPVKMKMNRRGRMVKERKKSNKPRGFDMLERLKKKIKKEEIDLGFASDKQSIDFQIRNLQFKKLQIELDQKQKIYDENLKNDSSKKDESLEKSETLNIEDPDKIDESPESEDNVDIDNLENEICSDEENVSINDENSNDI